MRNYLAIIILFLVTITQAQIMLPAYQAIQYRGNTLPTITTSTVTSVTSTTGASGGTITTDGGTPITVRGICWSTTSGPTIALATKTTDGTGIGNFISTMTGLTVGTTYYARAYATNGVGTAYGNEVVYIAVFPNCGTVTDIDGNVYETVLIGTQCWMTKNLNVSRYRNGDAIPQIVGRDVTSNSQWCNLTSGAWCYSYDFLYNSDLGKLYNAFACDDPRGLTPVGWHIPTAAEYVTLINYLSQNGGNFDGSITVTPNIGSNKLAKALCSNDVWPEDNTQLVGTPVKGVNLNNSSGFSALPGGSRYGSTTCSFGFSPSYYSYSTAGGLNFRNDCVARFWARSNGNAGGLFNGVGYPTKYNLEIRYNSVSAVLATNPQSDTNGYSVRLIKD